MRKAVLLVLLAVGVLSLRFRQNHAVHDSPYSAQQQLEKVTAQQKRFEEQFVALTREVEGVSSTLSNSTNPDERIGTLETFLLQWQQDVFDLSKTIIPAFNMSKCSCEGMTPDQKHRILRDIETLRKSVDELRLLAQRMERCDKTEQVIADARKQLFFLDTMTEILVADCRKSAKIGPTIFQTNLYAENWILGNYTTDDLVKLYTKRAEQYDNVTNCPQDRPFYAGNACIKCDSASPVFNIETERCGNCPPGEHVDNVQKRCTGQGQGGSERDSYRTNPDAGYLIAPWGLSMVATGRNCPMDHPYYNGHECINCQHPNNLFNATSRVCVSCPSGRMYSNEKKDCVDSPEEWKIYNTNSRAANVFGQLPERDSRYEDCPSDRPYFNGHKCIQCPYPNNLFNASSNECTSCPQGTYLAERDCRPIAGWKGTPTTANSGQFNNNPFASRILSKERIVRNPNLPNCPTERPYFDGNGCVNCDPPNELFNYTSKQCTSCGSNEIYSPDSMSCEFQTNGSSAATTTTGKTIWLSNLTNSNWLTNDGVPASIYQEINRRIKEPNTKLCPQGQQFFDGYRCIACSQEQYFNIDSKRCEACPWHKVFNLNLHRCVEAESAEEFQTNPNATNIIYDGLPSNSYQTIYQRNKERHPNIKDCPGDRPFYDGLSCINCLPPFSYFNLNQKVCQQCSANTTYSPTNRECESSEGKIIYQGPTLEKMLAGIF